MDLGCAPIHLAATSPCCRAERWLSTSLMISCVATSMLWLDGSPTMRLFVSTRKSACLRRYHPGPGQDAGGHAETHRPTSRSDPRLRLVRVIDLRPGSGSASEVVFLLRPSPGLGTDPRPRSGSAQSKSSSRSTPGKSMAGPRLRGSPGRVLSALNRRAVWHRNTPPPTVGARLHDRRRHAAADVHRVLGEFSGFRVRGL